MRRRTKHCPPIAWDPHDNLWLAEAKKQIEIERRALELEAQVGLFLLQTNLVSREGPVRDRLLEYLRGSFRWRAIEDPDAAAFAVYHHLLTHKWWSDDWRAWRMLVRACINGEIKKSRHRAASDPDLTPDAEGRLTVDQFAIIARISRSKAYELVRNGKVAYVKTRQDPRTKIPLADAEQLRDGIRRSDLIAHLEKMGRSFSAARKWVYRQEKAGKSLEGLREVRQVERLTRLRAHKFGP